MQRCEVCCDVHEFQNFLMYIKESELTVIGRAKFAPNKKNEKKRKVKKFALHIEMFFVCFLETKRWTESFGGASSEEFEVLPVCPPVC